MNNKPYPIIDGHRKHYVLHPVEGEDRLWRAAEVLLPSGYINPETNPAKVCFLSEEDCQRACDVHNKYIGLTKDEANQIISQSMGVSHGKR